MVFDSYSSTGLGHPLLSMNNYLLETNPDSWISPVNHLSARTPLSPDCTCSYSFGFILYGRNHSLTYTILIYYSILECLAYLKGSFLANKIFCSEPITGLDS